MAKRVIWIVLDSAGIGEEPDADKFGDVGSDTFGHILETYPDAKFDNLTKLGLRAIENTSFYDAATKQDVIGVYGKAQELSNGKDTTTGHWEMILPIQFLPDGGWKWTGYAGLASHGGTLGLMIALWLYCRKMKMHYMDVLDMIAVATPICACFIRLANLMNSEIIGKATDVPWAFVFERVDMLPRHPAQLYEAIAYFIFFLLMIFLYKNYGKKLHRGFFFGLCLTEIFVFRFFVEFLKENQVDFENSMSLNMGQWLSVPFVIIGVYFMFFYGKKKTQK